MPKWGRDLYDDMEDLNTGKKKPSKNFLDDLNAMWDDLEDDEDDER